MRQHQRPGGDRHQLPGEQEHEGIIGEHHQVHAGQEHRIEGQHALRRLLMLSVADGEQAGAAAAEAGDNKEECGQRVQPKMRADPGQAERQHHALHPRADRDQAGAHDRHRQRQGAAIDHDAPDRPARHGHTSHTESE